MRLSVDAEAKQEDREQTLVPLLRESPKRRDLGSLEVGGSGSIRGHRVQHLAPASSHLVGSSPSSPRWCHPTRAE